MDYYGILTSGIDGELFVEKIVHGLTWTGARLSDGRFGIALNDAAASRPRLFPSLEGMPARAAAEAVRSWNFAEASEGMAVINAFYNTAEHMAELNAECSFDKRCTQGLVTQSKKIALIGHLSLQPGALDGAAEVYIIERSPKSGDYPDSACEYILPECDIVIMTASSAVNKTLPRLLQLSENAEVIIIGPTASMCPQLKALGISRISGMVVRDVPEFCDWMTENRGSPYPFGDVFMI